MYLHQDLTEKILKSFYLVYHELGYGFLEKVYENAMKVDLVQKGLKVENQKPICVNFQNVKVGDYYADLLVENKVIVELKAGESICKEHEYQLINYLKATDIEVGLLLNFGKVPKAKRKIFTNDIKQKRSEWIDKK